MWKSTACQIRPDGVPAGSQNSGIVNLLMWLVLRKSRHERQEATASWLDNAVKIIIHSGCATRWVATIIVGKGWHHCICNKWPWYKNVDVGDFTPSWLLVRIAAWQFFTPARPRWQTWIRVPQTTLPPPTNHRSTPSFHCQPSRPCKAPGISAMRGTLVFYWMKSFCSRHIWNRISRCLSRRMA